MGYLIKSVRASAISVFRKSFLLLISIAVFGISSTQAVAEDILDLSTGLDSASNLILAGGQSDAYWTVDQALGGEGPAKTVFPDNADWFHGTGPNDPAWLPNGPGSNWIARDPHTSANGLGTYTRVFDLSGLDLSTVSITGAWAVDDVGTLSLNGNQIGQLPNLRWDALTPFSIAPGSPLLHQGQNQLTIAITSSDNYLEGVRLEGSVSIVPEPSAALMLVAGFILIFGVLRTNGRHVTT